jgi:hypothetical protein
VVAQTLRPDGDGPRRAVLAQVVRELRRAQGIIARFNSHSHEDG